MIQLSILNCFFCSVDAEINLSIHLDFTMSAKYFRIDRRTSPVNLNFFEILEATL